MPAVSPHVLISAILEAIQQAGGSGIYLSTTDRTHPREFLVHYLDQSFYLWVYIWTLTHGGRTSLPNEYRIQMTSVQSPLQLNPNGYTALLGYYPDLRMFAGFDLQVHHTFTPGSSSVQITITAIHEALQNGLAFDLKNNLEIAIGIRPDQLIHYILNAQDLHIYGREATVRSLLERATRIEEIPTQDIESLSTDRRRVVSNVTTYSRHANFSDQVLNAYGHRCAVTRMQLRLVDAAHILPIPAEHSSDHVTNGIALSPTIHRAFDNCLVFLDEDYNMRLNNRKANELSRQSLDAGLVQFRELLNRRIHLPADSYQWPNVEFIRRANRHRRIPSYY